MPYRRRRYNKRNAKRSKVVVNVVRKRRSQRNSSSIGRLRRDVAMLKGMTAREMKYKDDSQQNQTDAYWVISATSTLAVIGNYSSPPQAGYLCIPVAYPEVGDDYNQREGRQIKVKGLQLKGRVAVNYSTTNAIQQYGQAKVMFIVDHQAQNGEIVNVVTELFEPDMNGDYSMSSRVNRQKAGRFSILASRKYNLGSSAPIKDVNIYKRLNDIVKFRGTAATDFQDKKFFVVVLTNPNFAPATSSYINPELTWQGETRLTYVDN